MDKIEKTEKLIEKKVTGLMTGRPYWVWLVVYVVITALIFAAAYVVFKVLTVQWWVTVLIIILLGAVWSVVAYANRPPAVEDKTPKK